MEGGTLHSLLSRFKNTIIGVEITTTTTRILRIREHIAQFYAAELILAVRFLHSLGIIHR
jgi:serine/threonine protein kinase